MKLFFRTYLPFCLLVGFVLYALYSQFGARLVDPLTAYTFGFFVVLTAGLYWVIDRLLRRDPDSFMVAYFGAMVVRLLLSLTLVLVYLYSRGRPVERLNWALLLNFFLLYFLFAGFEIWAVLSNLRPFSKRG